MNETRDKPSNTGPVFFVSYPRPPADERFQGADRDYTAFFHDLCAALARVAPLDRLHNLGSLSPEWAADNSRDGAGDAARDIAECDVFVPLHSPRYFESEACGKELAAFESRVDRANKPRPTAILPVLWAPVSPQWDASQPPPYRSGQTDVDEEYLTYGLIRLQEVSPSGYRRVVADLAQRIADISAGRPVDRGQAADLAALPSSLRMAERQPLVVVLLAPTLGRPPGASRPRYGERITDWAPFPAEGPARLVDSLVVLARSKGWEPEVVPFSDTDPRLFGPVEPDRQVILVVDPRALDDPRWCAALERFDALDTPWAGVVAVTSPGSTAQEQKEQARLRDQLFRVLNRKFARRSPSLRIDAPISTSLRSFDLALDATANNTRIRLANPQHRPSYSPQEETPS